MQTDEHTVDVPSELLAELVSVAWETFVGVVPDPAPPTDDFEDSIDASIAIGGPRHTVVLLRCSRAAALQAASTALGLTAPRDADVHDVLGELANIIGGNVKGVMSGDETDWTLSLPVVSTGRQSLPGTALRSEADFACAGAPVRCELHELV